MRGSAGVGRVIKCTSTFTLGSLGHLPVFTSRVQVWRNFSLKFRKSRETAADAEAGEGGGPKGRGALLFPTAMQGGGQRSEERAEKVV